MAKFVPLLRKIYHFNVWTCAFLTTCDKLEPIGIKNIPLSSSLPNLKKAIQKKTKIRASV